VLEDQAEALEENRSTCPVTNGDDCVSRSRYPALCIALTKSPQNADRVSIAYWEINLMTIALSTGSWKPMPSSSEAGMNS